MQVALDAFVAKSSLDVEEQDFANHIEQKREERVGKLRGTTEEAQEKRRQKPVEELSVQEEDKQLRSDTKEKLKAELSSNKGK